MGVSFDDNILAQQVVRFINGTNRNIFLTGKAGTGKTTLLHHIKNNTHKNTVIVAPTGIAAINAGGVTIHSMFQLPFGTLLPSDDIDLSKESFLEIHTPTQLIKKSKLNSRKRKLIHQIELLVIDEVSMLRADVLDAIDLVMRFVRRSRLPFAGVQVLFIGDLLQLPPIVRREEQSLISRFYRSIFFFDALVLTHCQPIVIELDKIYRQNDIKFISILNNFRENKASESDFKELNKYYIPEFEPPEDKYYISLTTHNRKADKINQTNLQEIDEPEFIYKAEINQDFPAHLFPIDEELLLKEGAQVMFIKNDYSGLQQYFNGKIGKICSLSKNSIKVVFDENNEAIEVEKYTWENKRYEINEETNEIVEYVIGTFTQYPIKLAWAVTIHKSQGLTFERAIIDVSETFAPGQMYVALSRLVSLDGLVLSHKLDESGPSQNSRLLSFVNNKADEKNLESTLAEESHNYIFNFLNHTFNFAQLCEIIKEHIGNCVKTDDKLKKTTHIEFCKSIELDITELSDIAFKFRRQLLMQNNENIDLSFIHDRLLSSKKFFSPKLFDCNKKIYEHISKLTDIHGYKEIIAELRLIESMIFDKLKLINKSIVIIDSANKSKSILDIKVDNSEIIEQRLQLLKSCEPPPKFLPGKKKNDTKSIISEMLSKDFSINEISKQLSISKKAVENHIITLIADDEVSIDEFVDKNIVDEVEKIMIEQETKSVKKIKENLSLYATNQQIKFSLAYLEF